MSASMDKLAQVKLTELVVNPKNDIVDGPFGSRLKASEYVDAGVPIVRLQNIDRNQFVDKNIKFVTKAKAKEIARHHFISGDILISKLGDPLGEACIAPKQFPYGILVADVVRVRPDKKKVDTSFLAYALNSAPVVQQFKAETKGTTRPRVNLKKIRDLRIPIVETIAQQRQIVAEIEKQFTRLDAGVAALRRVQANLKRYRAAVLGTGCEGRLVPTEAELAKAAGRSFETGEQLLARILADRRKTWHGRGKYKEPAAPDTANLLPLPEGWTWASPNQLSSAAAYALAIGPFGSNLKVSDYTDAGVPLVFVRNIRSARFGGERTVFVSASKANELRAHHVGAGDILVTKMGEPPGKACLYPDSAPDAVITADCIKLRLTPILPQKRFFVHAINSEVVKPQIQLITKGVAQMKISLGRFGSLAIPMPPLAEQVRIVAEVERRLSVIEELEAAVAANLQRATRLRQSILKQSFSGETNHGPR